MKRLLVLALLFPAGCAPVCSGVLVAPDVAVTAAHCLDGFVLYEAAVVAPLVRVGDEVRLRGVTGKDRLGRVLRLEDGHAYLDVVAMPGDSGGPVTDGQNVLVGVIVGRVVPGNQAVVQLL